MSKRASRRGIVGAGLAIIALPVQLAFSAASPTPPPPRPGAWTLRPIGSGTGLSSGGFTLTSSRTVIDLHAKISRTTIAACASGTAEVKGPLRLSVVTIGQGIRQWTVGSGRNTSGGLASVPVNLTIDGRRQANATITIAFPVPGQAGAGELNWGPIETGIQDCVHPYYVIAG